MRSPQSLIEATRLFSNPDSAHAYFRDLRWPDGIIPCPVCGSMDHWFLATQRRWKCKLCKKQFSVKVGTIFEDSPLGLDKWLIAVWLITNAKNGISSCEIARALEVTQKTAWFMLHRIRLAMQEGTFNKVGGKGGTEIEVDETFIGGKARNMHTRKKIEKGITQGTHNGNKSVVLGILERGGHVRTFMVGGTRRKDLVPLIRKHVKEDSTLYTDALPSYVMLPDWFRHEFVDHAVEYVNGHVHTNGIENFWSLLKRTLCGTYVSVEPFHLWRYLDEQAFRFNMRKLDDGQRFVIVTSQVAGRRVTYKKLTGKELAAGGI
jgi:transposase-like protein